MTSVPPDTPAPETVNDPPEIFWPGALIPELAVSNPDNVDAFWTVRPERVDAPETLTAPAAVKTFWTVRADSVVLPVTFSPVETPNPAPVSVTPAFDSVEVSAPFAAD